jgi:hypothetical protein
MHQKRIAADGLQLLYKNDLQFSMLIRYIWALSYMPPDMVVSAWRIVIQNKVRLAAPAGRRTKNKSCPAS